MARTTLAEVLPGQIFGLRSATDASGAVYIVDPYNNVCTFHGTQGYKKITTPADNFAVPFEPHQITDKWPHAKGMELNDSGELPLDDGVFVQGYLSGRVYEIKDRKLVYSIDYTPGNANTSVPCGSDTYNIVDPKITRALITSTKDWNEVLRAVDKNDCYAWRFTGTGSRVYITKGKNAATYRNGECRKLKFDTLKKSGWCLTTDVPDVVADHFKSASRNFVDACYMFPQASALISSEGTVWLRQHDCLIASRDQEHVKLHIPIGDPKKDEFGWKPYSVQVGTHPLPVTLENLTPWEGAEVHEIWNENIATLIHIESATCYQLDVSDGLVAVPYHVTEPLPNEGWVSAKFDGAYNLDLESARNAARTSGWSYFQESEGIFCWYYGNAHRYYRSKGVETLEMVPAPIGHKWTPCAIGGRPAWSFKCWLSDQGEVYHNPQDGLFYLMVNGKVREAEQVKFPEFRGGTFLTSDAVPEWFLRYLKLTPYQRALGKSIDREQDRKQKTIETAAKAATALVAKYTSQDKYWEKRESDKRIVEMGVNVGPPPQARIEGTFTAEQIIKLIETLKSLAETMSKQGSHEHAAKIAERITYLAGSVSWSLK